MLKCELVANLNKQGADAWKKVDYGYNIRNLDKDRLIQNVVKWNNCILLENMASVCLTVYKVLREAGTNGNNVHQFWVNLSRGTAD
jgi:hypothetical protein